MNAALLFAFASALWAQTSTPPAVSTEPVAASTQAVAVSTPAPAAVSTEAVAVSTQAVAVSTQAVVVSTPAPVAVSTEAIAVSTQSVAVSTPPAISTSSASVAVSTPAHVALSTPPLEIRLLSVGSYHATASMPHTVPFERMLIDRRADIELLDVEDVPAYFNGGAYRYSLPEINETGAGPSTGTAQAAVLESEYGYFLLWPPEPELFAAARDAFRRPEMYRRPLSPRVSEREASMLVAGDAEGGWVHSATIETPRLGAGQWRKTVAIAYRLNIRGRRVEAVFLQKTLGGLARLAAALADEREAGPSIVISRGTRSARAAGEGLEGRAWLDALENMGLAVSAVGLGELRYYDDLAAYRLHKSSGIAFVSANLVKAETASSSAPVSVLPPFVVREAGGVRVGFLGLTRGSYGRYLTAGRWKGLAIVDPVAAALKRIPELRRQADLVVVLSELDEEDNARLRNSARGIDVLFAEDEPFLPVSLEPKTVRVSEEARPRFAACLMTATEFQASITRVTARLGRLAPDETRPLELASGYRVLDESVADAAGFPETDVQAYGVAGDTRPALIPSARQMWPPGRGALGLATLRARDFWTLSASLIADRHHAEMGALPLMPIAARSSGETRESQIRDWFTWDDSVVVFELRGKDLTALLKLAREQAGREAQGLPAPPGEFPFVLAGAPDDRVHGAPIQPEAVYRVAGSALLLGNAGAVGPLRGAHVVDENGPLRDAVIDSLRRAASGRWGADRYRALAEGVPVRERGVWRVNFRDVSLNTTNTHVVEDRASFAQVPDPRVQGFDQQVVGITAKTDADYLYKDFHWGNSFALEYSRARLRPPNAPQIINTPNNRLDLQTTVTRRVAGIPVAWLARSFGPSMGFEYEGQVAATPGLRRKQVYSLLPGVEFFDGTVVQSLQLSAGLKRDYSRVVPNNQYGLRGRLVLSTPLRAGLRLTGEFLTRYYFLTRRDSDQDLRLESEMQIKLHVPLYKSLTLAPFANLYIFQLKTTPASGYSFLTGISLGFSRLWKPGYEKF